MKMMRCKANNKKSVVAMNMKWISMQTVCFTLDVKPSSLQLNRINYNIVFVRRQCFSCLKCFILFWNLLYILTTSLQVLILPLSPCTEGKICHTHSSRDGGKPPLHFFWGGDISPPSWLTYTTVPASRMLSQPLYHPGFHVLQPVSQDLPLAFLLALSTLVANGFMAHLQH